MKKALKAVLRVLLSPELRPSEVKIIRAVVAALITAYGVKLGIDFS